MEETKGESTVTDDTAAEETKASGDTSELDVIIDIRERLAALISLAGELPKGSAVQSFESDLKRAQESFGNVEKVMESRQSQSLVGRFSHQPSASVRLRLPTLQAKEPRSTRPPSRCH